VLAVSAAAVAADARSVAATAEWAADAPGRVLAALGVGRDPLTRRCHLLGGHDPSGTPVWMAARLALRRDLNEGVRDALCALTLTGTRPSARFSRLPGGLVPLSYCPRSSLPADVLAWLADRLAHLLPSRPPGRGGTPPLSLEVRLDAVGSVLLDGLSYRRAGRAVGISKTEVGDSLDLPLGELAAVGYCQPDGTFITSLADLGQWLAEMTACGEAVVVDGLAWRPGATSPRVDQPEGAVRRQAPHPHRAGPGHLDHPRRPAVGGWRLAGPLPRARAHPTGRA
jgi:hypothetical protein